MLLHIPHILSPEEVQHAQRLLAAAPWADGRSSAGSQARAVKNNEQLPHDCDAATEIRAMLLRGLDRNPTFFSAALPKRVYTPQLNRYQGGSNFYGNHVDNAVRFAPDTGLRVRTDISCTLFLSEPTDYDGGELVVQDSAGAQRVKLPAGDMVLYEGTSVHQVEPVTRGARLACFFWIESMVRSGEQRRMLLDMDMALLGLRQQHGETPETTALTGTYHNLLRMWADT
ncbi:PKHD-type hydroxylase [Rhodoferax sp. OV413]|uniref:Fe2+-dependent dioxygenase n=1 Tax=Rhodoferax sp. OV413 TaxID=1855285 RepID=UPI00087E47D6|nr:Fe2+-dependent dioxygenase [Rhodoferax sp. OV413]SDP20404.1 PKHD-type hydroxylase [Rhodoferax sp. OV413]